MFNARNLYKLATREGARTGYVHNVLGALVLAHYGYRLFLRLGGCVFFLQTGRQCYADPFAGLEASDGTAVLIAMHMTLSATALFFAVPATRSRGKPMIWREFRLHSILFAFRSFLGMLLVWACARYDVPAQSAFPRLGRFTLVWWTLAIADRITEHYRSMQNIGHGDTTMRMMPYPPSWPAGVRAALNAYYGFSQFIATTAILLNTSLFTLLMSAFPIQLAAFLMTCVRKGILSNAGWHVIYTASLVAAFLTTVGTWSDVLATTAVGVLLYGARRLGGVGKYRLWFVTCIVLPPLANARA
jgi:hypothetical protein